MIKVNSKSSISFRDSVDSQLREIDYRVSQLYSLIESIYHRKESVLILKILTIVNLLCNIFILVKLLH